MKQESIYEISGGGRFSYGVRLSKRGFLYKKNSNDLISVLHWSPKSNEIEISF
jgi:hypothetical protein